MAQQNSPAARQREAHTIPFFHEILGRSVGWVEKNVGQFHDQVSLKEWLKSKNPAANHAIGTAFHIFLPDSKSKHGPKTLELTISKVGEIEPLVTSVNWAMTPPQSFEAAFFDAKLDLKDFEFVSEKTIMYGWDVTTLRRKDNPKTLLEITRTESFYRVKMMLDLSELLKGRSKKPSPL